MSPTNVPALRGGGAAALPSVSVFICSARRPAVLSDTIASVMRQTLRPHEIIVSFPDDGSPGLGPPWVEHPLLREIRARPGHTRQANAAIAAIASGVDFVATFDDDVELEPHWLEMAAEAMQMDPGIVGLTGYPMANGGITREEGKAAVAGWQREKLAARGCFKNGDWHLYGCNVMFRKSDLEAVLYDERLPDQGFMDDYDLSVRLARRGDLACHVGCLLAHLCASAGRAPGAKFGLAQMVVSRYLWGKGVMSFDYFIRSTLYRFPGANLYHGLRGDSQVDRWGRLRGNLLGMLWIAIGIATPERLEHFVQKTLVNHPSGA